MIRVASAPRKFNLLAAVALIVGGGAVAALAVSVLAGTKTGLILALGSIFGPAFFYTAIVTPLVSPFGLYVLLVPFDNLLSVSAFGTLTKFLGLISGAALLFYLLRTRRMMLPSPSLLLWGAFFVWAAASAFWASDEQLLLPQLGTSLSLVCLYAVISLFPAENAALRWTSIAVIAGGLLAAAYGTYLFHSGVDVYYGGRLRITNETGSIDPNQFAAAMLLPIALCLTTLLHTRKILPAVGSFAGLIMLFAGIAVSASRGAVLGIIAMLIYFMVRSKARVRLLVMAGVAAAASVFLSPDSALWDRFGEAWDTGGSGRTAIWKVGFEALKSHWLLGYGYGNFPIAYDSAFLKTYLTTPDIRWHSGSHNLLVGTSVEVGLIGLVLLLAAWVSQFTMLRNIDPSEPEYPTRVALEATVIALFIASLFLDIMNFKYVWLTFMMVALLRNAHLIRRQRNLNA